MGRFMRSAPLLLSAATLSAAAAFDPPTQDPIALHQQACPDYTVYSTVPHRPLSDGPLALPFQRPDARCRTFQSDAIEQVISDMKSRMKDPDLARLFENAFPSTTDTTIKWHKNAAADGRASTDDGDDATPAAYEVRPAGDGDPRNPRTWDGPQSFIVTGDIVAEWLRDSTNQLAPYQPLAKKDAKIHDLILGAINTQAVYVRNSPYCNAFQPPPIAGLSLSHNGQDDVVHPAYEPTFVFECKYELDSLANFLALGTAFFTATNGSMAFVTPSWRAAVETVLRVLDQQSRGTFDADTGRLLHNEYTFQRYTNTATETLALDGQGHPLAPGMGLIRSAFRPSDDACTLGFLIPANAMMAVQLTRTASVLRATGRPADAALADELARRGDALARAVRAHGVVAHPRYGDVFAYEVDGYGSAIFMDDANMPSLLSLPLLGFVDSDDPTYLNTRRMLLDRAGNPYFRAGAAFRGIGGPHAGLATAWPMAVLVQALTSDDDAEIQACLDQVLHASRLGLVHESVDVDDVASYTRSWFAWANGVFAQTILDLARRKPHLIFRNDRPYSIE